MILEGFAIGAILFLRGTIVAILLAIPLSILVRFFSLISDFFCPGQGLLSAPENPFRCSSSEYATPK